MGLYAPAFRRSWKCCASGTGAPECWIVDPDQGSIEVYALERGVYALLGHWERGEVAASRVLAGFQVAVDEVLGA